MSECIEAIEGGREWKMTPGLAYLHEDQVHFSPVRDLIENLDSLPFADRYMAEGDGSNIEVMLEGTRGCLFSCSFCAVHPFYKRNKGSKLRLRSAESIVSEIDVLCKQYPALQCFRFVDPDFISPFTQERAARFAELMKKKQRNVHFMMDTRITSIRTNLSLLKSLQEVGLRRLYLGIESGSEKVLKKMRKGITRQETIQGIRMLKELELDYSYGFMMITPWTLEQDIEDNVDLLANIGRIEFRSLFHEMTLIPGTKAYEMVSDINSLEWCGSLSYYSFRTDSPKVEKFRKISKLLQKTYPACFGEAAGFLYESIRQLRRVGQGAFVDPIEAEVDQLFLDVFYTCWDLSSKTEQSLEKDLQDLDDCYQTFHPRFLSLLHRIDATIDCTTAKQRVPKYAPTKQI